jgi:predicted helicase
VRKHFGKNLIDRDVEILDPATGTGTFICELLEHFRGQPKKLAHKYREELHANEVAILPYYVANLNIEATYAAITGQYAEFPNLCFVDTLDNVGLHTAAKGTTARPVRQRQRGKRGAHQAPEQPQDQRRHRQPALQRQPGERERQQQEPRIPGHRRSASRQTYIAESTAQKTKLYDMYARFFRWASDRLNENGVLAFVTNRSFIESRTFDGFRKTVAKEFADIYVVDLGGDVRANPKLSGTKHNVFGIQTGVAISFMVKVNLTSNDFETLMPLASKETKAAKTAGKERAIFKLFSLGVVTNRDEWVYDERDEALHAKVNFLVETYNGDVSSHQASANAANPHADFGTAIKWTRAVKADLNKGLRYTFDDTATIEACYRPFVKRRLYFHPKLNEMQYQLPSIFGRGEVRNPSIVISDATAQKPWMVCAVEQVPDLHFVGAAAGTVCMPVQRLAPDGGRADNITDWALKQFTAHYKEATATGAVKASASKARKITKEAIFHYCYAVLHDPVYREKYAQNLKREFPRVPLYGTSPADFWQWAAWGEALMALHIGYEAVAPFPLARTDTPDDKARAAGLPPKALLRADPAASCITLDSETTLRGVPPEAWTYKLGNRCALDWVLDQYKEKKPKDPTIREKFDTYRFADHKEKVIDLLARVTTVSVETVRIVAAMQVVGR